MSNGTLGQEIGRPCWFLIPERQDSREEFGNGAVHTAEALHWLLDAITTLVEGLTRGITRAEVRGVWKTIEDVSVRFEVALSPEKYPALVSFLEEVAVKFGQECIYCVLGGTDARLVYRRARAA